VVKERGGPEKQVFSFSKFPSPGEPLGGKTEEKRDTGYRRQGIGMGRVTRKGKTGVTPLHSRHSANAPEKLKLRLEQDSKRLF